MNVAPRSSFIVRLRYMADCYSSALRILHYRFNSEAELRRKLRAKKFAPDEIDAAIARLHREKWLDDARFAGAFVRTRANKRVGRLRIRRELQAAGVSGDEADKALAENVDAEREGEALRELCARRARVLVRRHGNDYLASDEAHAKLTAYLIAQGYDSALVRQVVRDIVRQADM
ncbi:MAG TPA: RecX family transcriptional regulator [Thermoanaerobaculia bacterium]|jgi:regulatory protein|nr:RecX family transcriptional regulator [Thermoanaerobaculia bacterium]